MSFASKHNKGAIDWGIDTEGFEYFKLSELYELVQDADLKLHGLFINSKNNSEYGASCVAILEDRFVNLPQHMIEEIQGILADPEDVEAIKAGKVGFKIRTYESDKKKGKDKTCYAISWVDL